MGATGWTETHITKLLKQIHHIYAFETSLKCNELITQNAKIFKPIKYIAHNIMAHNLKGHASHAFVTQNTRWNHEMNYDRRFA